LLHFTKGLYIQEEVGAYTRHTEQITKSPSKNQYIDSIMTIIDTCKKDNKLSKYFSFNKREKNDIYLYNILVWEDQSKNNIKIVNAVSQVLRNKREYSERTIQLAEELNNIFNRKQDLINIIFEYFWSVIKQVKANCEFLLSKVIKTIKKIVVRSSSDIIISNSKDV
jgi:hypothetical protein